MLEILALPAGLIGTAFCLRMAVRARRAAMHRSRSEPPEQKRAALHVQINAQERELGMAETVWAEDVAASDAEKHQEILDAMARAHQHVLTTNNEMRKAFPQSIMDRLRNAEGGLTRLQDEVRRGTYGGAVSPSAVSPSAYGDAGGGGGSVGSVDLTYDRRYTPPSTPPPERDPIVSRIEELNEIAKHRGGRLSDTELHTLIELKRAATEQIAALHAIPIHEFGKAEPVRYIMHTNPLASYPAFARGISEDPNR